MSLETRKQVVDRIRKKGRGWVFTSHDFTDAIDPFVVRATLRRLQRKGRLKLISKDVYYYPRHLRELGIEVPPEPVRVARALARLRGHRVVMSGAAAANRFGLSTQVPAKTVFLTDGPTRRIRLGNLTILLRHDSPKRLRVQGGFEREVIQAVRFIGRDAIDENVISTLRRAAPKERRAKLEMASRRVGGWVGDVLVRIAKPA